MVRLAICDDESEVVAELERALTDIFGKLTVEPEIDIFLTGKELCRKMEAGFSYDLIFLDIEFAQNEINGVEVGNLIRNTHNNNLVSIVYISWEKEYAMQLFTIRPMDFLLKPLNIAQIEETVRTYLRITGLISGMLTYKKGHDIYDVRLKDIVYLENNMRKIIIFFSDGNRDEFYGSLKEIYDEQLKNLDFIYSHASYVVNFDYVKEIKSNKLLVTDSLTPVPISQHKSTEVKKKYMEMRPPRRVG